MKQLDDELLELFDVVASGLPDVKDCAADYGCADLLIGMSLPIRGVAGDQQAAAIDSCLRRAR